MKGETIERVIGQALGRCSAYVLPDATRELQIAVAEQAAQKLDTRWSEFLDEAKTAFDMSEEMGRTYIGLEVLAAVCEAAGLVEEGK